MDLNTLKASILEDGKIDASEVAQLKQAIYADGKIDSEEADFLFELNDACSGANNDPSWEAFFIDAICDYLLKDENTPGEIDEQEGKWLLGKIQGDGKLDGIELNLLKKLNSSAKTIGENLKSFINQNI